MLVPYRCWCGLLRRLHSASNHGVLQVEVVAGLHNGAVDTFNVSAIFGSLNDPSSFKTFFYNFSGQVPSCSRQLMMPSPNLASFAVSGRRGNSDV